MIGRIKTSWRIFAAGRPGFRFRERYRLRRGRKPGGFDLVSLSHLLGGAALIVLSALFGWLPVLGWGTAVLGLGMIAGEFYPAARLMDWLEVRARRLFRPLGKAFAKWPAWAQLSASLTIALATFAFVYGLYSLALAG
ncbi:MAG: hypothetical protein H0U91_04335 [Rubrobacter sp.]|jgi:hypothetical protein|nr:hypothetical protein [Rubrobacter sp.]MBA3952197.1 hypothetical protein [Rubrobacter sp.]MDQ3361942.1 hypothetical protein [Actinomycetota bacterium]MDQ3377051.1 hypothetical protein [Actinomycetota bacterium]